MKQLRDEKRKPTLPFIIVSAIIRMDTNSIILMTGKG